MKKWQIYQVLWTSLCLKSLPEKDLIHLLMSGANSRHTSLTLSTHSPIASIRTLAVLRGGFFWPKPHPDFKRVVFLVLAIRDGSTVVMWFMWYTGIDAIEPLRDDVVYGWNRPVPNRSGLQQTACIHYGIYVILSARMQKTLPFTLIN